MSYDSVEEMFEASLNASENPEEGLAAGKYIGGENAKKLAQIEAQKELERERLEEQAETKAKQAEEAKKEEALKKLREKREQEEKEREENRLRALAAKEKAENERLAAEADKKQKAEEKARLEKEKAEEKARLAAEKLAAEEEQKRLEEEARIEAEEKAKRDEENRRNLQKAAEEEAERKRIEAEAKLKETEATAVSLQANAFESVKLIVTLTDLYRSYDKDTQATISKFFEVENELEVITQVLSQSDDTKKGIYALSGAKEATQVDRAFLLMALDEDLLFTIGVLIEQYTGKKIEPDVFKDKIPFCRDLEAIINGLSEVERNHLSSLEELLNTSN